MDPRTLVCPRCRQVDEHGIFRVTPLAGPHGLAVAGGLEEARALHCPNCLAGYPVVAGIPLIFAQPEALELGDFLAGITAFPSETLEALLQGLPPDAPLASLMRRVARYAWAGFADHLGEGWAVPGISLPVHAVSLVRWLEGLEAAQPPCPVGADEATADIARPIVKSGHFPTSSSTHRLTLVLGAALGREAWALGTGQTVLLDAHLPSLLASKVLARTGRLPLFFPEDRYRWREVCLEVPPPTGELAWVCADAQNPPFLGAGFGQVLAPNLIDSVAQPSLVVQQALALTAPGGLLALSTPFSWREEVTPRGAWLEDASSGPEGGPGVVRRMLLGLGGAGARLAETELSWALRVDRREAVVYQSRAFGLRLAR